MVNGRNLRPVPSEPTAGPKHRLECRECQPANVGCAAECWMPDTCNQIRAEFGTLDTAVPDPRYLLESAIESDQNVTADLADALRAVLDQHPHTFYNEWYRQTPHREQAVCARCQVCGNLPDVRWCRTVAAIVEHLGGAV
ncbi:hypothetical protein AB0L88_03080 [Saccharopolyspora shandongensis]|uniref:hypothetical protein n=1 Tax=Saccharopolyspora shandongensis TaxID=418495 RepID=UPI00341DA203